MSDELIDWISTYGYEPLPDPRLDSHPIEVVVRFVDAQERTFRATAAFAARLERLNLAGADADDLLEALPKLGHAPISLRLFGRGEEGKPVEWKFGYKLGEKREL